jgi:DNA-binding MarR family transcriptional regulator
MSRRNHRGDSNKAPRFVQLFEWMMDSWAWQSLSPTEIALYLLLKRRFNGKNNGRIPLSVREAAEALHVGKSTAAEAFQVLQARGFIVAREPGRFDRKVRHSTEWRLTEHQCNVTGEFATKAFTQAEAAAREKSRYPRADRTVPEAGPIGTSGRTVNPENRRYGTSGRTVNVVLAPPSVPEAGHYLIYHVPRRAMRASAGPARAPSLSTCQVERHSASDTATIEQKTPGGRLSCC